MLTQAEIAYTLEVIKRENTDHLGLIVQKDGDRGDTAHKTGIAYYLYLKNLSLVDHNGDNLIVGFKKALDQIEVAPGVWVRHPIPAQEYVANPADFSRDQEINLIIAMGEYPEERERLKRMIGRRWSRFGRYQNKDIMGPQHLSADLRSLNNKLTYPILFLTDVGLVFDAVVAIARRMKDKNDVDVIINDTMMLDQARRRMPTPWSWLARQIMKLTNIQSAWDTYFHPSSNAPPLNVFARVFIDRL